jgi:hypothetical protein
VSAPTREATLQSGDDLVGTLGALGLGDRRPVIILIGGADGLTSDREADLRTLFAGCLSPVAQELGAAIVDGGTDAGVMRMIGESRAAAGHDYPLIGVASIGTVGTRGADGARAPIDRNHSHVIQVPGETWGDEGHWMRAVAGAIAVERNRVTLLVNGGRFAADEAVNSAASGIPVVVVAGSGRAADRFAADLGERRGAGSNGNLIAVDLRDLGALRAVLIARLGKST